MQRNQMQPFSASLCAYSSIDGWHGELGHFNVLTRDHDSVVTGFGIHDRVMTTLPQFDSSFGCVTLYCRVDTKWELGEPTPQQVLKVARESDNTKGRWILKRREEHDNGKHIDFYFVPTAKVNI